MKCKNCSTTVNILDTICTQCGASLSLLNNEPKPLLQADSLFEQTNLAIDQELARMEQELCKELITSPLPGTSSDNTPSFRRLAGLPAPTENFFLSAGRVNLKTVEEEIYQIAGFVMQSSHVQTNILYRQRAAATSLVYLSENPTVNAFATDGRHPDLDVSPPFIAILGGMTNASRLISLALGYDRVADNRDSRQLLVRTMQTIGKKIVEQGGRLSLEDSTDIFTGSGLAQSCEDGEVQRKARSYGAAMNMSVIGHELGHIALGHTLRLAEVPDGVIRNQEREADSFSASVAGASPFSDYTVAGGIFWWVILTWVEAVAGTTDITTHPYSRERLMDYIRANLHQARDIGIDESNVQEFLP